MSIVFTNLDDKSSTELVKMVYMDVVPQGFIDWLQEEMERRNLGIRETARLAGVSHPTVSDILNGKQPSIKTCKALAKVFGKEERWVAVLAGYFKPEPNITPDMDAVIQAMSDLPESWQAMIAADARRTREFYEQQERERLERDRATLLRKKDTGKLPNLP